MKILFIRWFACLILPLLILQGGCEDRAGTGAPAPPPGPGAARPPSTAPATVLRGDFRIEPRQYWEILRADEFAIIIPRNWSQLSEELPSATVLYLVKRGVIDETGNPVEVGLMVERFPQHPRTMDEEIQRLITRYREVEQTELTSDPVIQTLQLSGGSEARLLLLEMTTQAKLVRRSAVAKLVAIDDQENAWIVTGYVVAGKDSIIGTHESNIAQMLLAHVTSFTLDPQQVNEQPVHQVYHAQAAPIPQP